MHKFKDLRMKIRMILLLIFTLTQLSFAKETLVAGLFNIVPYAYKEKGKVVGITPEIIQNIQKESGIEIKTILLPYKRMLNYLESGKIDFAIFFLSDFSESFSEKLLPLYSLETIVVGKKGFKLTNYKDLYSIRLATPRGVNYNSKLDKNKKTLNIRYVKDYNNAILMLNLDRIDAIIAPKRILSYQLKQMGMKLSNLGDPYILTTNTAWIQFSNKSLKQKYKQTLITSAKTLLEKGEVEAIIQKYYSR